MAKIEYRSPWSVDITKVRGSPGAFFCADTSRGRVGFKFAGKTARGDRVRYLAMTYQPRGPGIPAGWREEGTVTAPLTCHMKDVVAAYILGYLEPAPPPPPKTKELTHG